MFTGSRVDGIDHERRGPVCGVEAGHLDDGGADHQHAEGAVQAADGGA